MTRLLAEPDLVAWGEGLAARLPAGAVLWLEGALGAGKTTLVRALARGRGAGDGATSPTFSLVHRYEGPRGVIAHVDCYRFRTPEEAEAVEWELFREADLLLVEWPARGGAWVPPPDLTIRLSHVEDEDRRGLEVVPHTVDVSAHD